MTSSLVGSEMCIRDSPHAQYALPVSAKNWPKHDRRALSRNRNALACSRICLLYTSDAADDM
eukprot:8575213-Prorocentrum_lima.AAC.1